MRILICCLGALLYPFKSNSQKVADDFNTLFAFEVHTIDDFFERFNFKQNTAFLNFLAKNYQGNDLSRSRLIQYLFNYKNDSINSDDILPFLSQVLEEDCPEFLNYKDADWYAELRCKVYYKKKSQNLTLILKVEQSKRKYFRWSVVSAKADFLNISRTKDDSLRYLWDPPYRKIDTTFSSKYFLSPVSHALDFMDLDKIFFNNNHVSEYVYNGPQSSSLLKFVDQVKRSEITFVQVNSVKYHLLQIDNWIMVVEYFFRDEKNSGWLINKLVKATREQKENYLTTSLNIPVMTVSFQQQ